MTESYEPFFASLRRRDNTIQIISVVCPPRIDKNKLKQEKRKQIREEEAFPVTPSLALKLALGDAETSHFIKTNFSYPEQRPRIISRKKLSRQEKGYRWIVEFIEKIPVSLNGKNGLMNIARIEIDPLEGKIIRRLFFSYILEEEYQKSV
jgi:hypothetical protein